MFRDFADVVLQSELRQNLRLPKIAGGQRQVFAVPASSAFKAYQRVLAQRIRGVEQRQRKPQKGDDILLRSSPTGARGDRPQVRQPRATG